MAMKPEPVFQAVGSGGSGGRYASEKDIAYSAG